jgi:[ribosomal protein S18]-alanine N-acetyltransferase
VKFIVRPMALADIDPVQEIDQVSFTLPWPRRSFHFELTENPASRNWVAVAELDDGTQRLAGMLVLWQIIDEAHIGTIAIHPDFRRMGIGRRMLARAILESTREGMRTFYLEVRITNIAAQAMYTQLGFIVEGSRARYYRDTNEDALLMTLTNPDLNLIESFADEKV